MHTPYPCMQTPSMDADPPGCRSPPPLNADPFPPVCRPPSPWMKTPSLWSSDLWCMLGSQPPRCWLCGLWVMPVSQLPRYQNDTRFWKHYVPLWSVIILLHWYEVLKDSREQWQERVRKHKRLFQLPIIMKRSYKSFSGVCRMQV